DTQPFILEWSSQMEVKEADFFPDSSEKFEVQPQTEKLSADLGKVRLRGKVKKLSGDWPNQICGVVIQRAKDGGDRIAYEVNVAFEQKAEGASTPASTSLWEKLAY